jgi:hypothetical protein
MYSIPTKYWVKYEDSKYCIRIKTNSYRPLRHICVGLICRLPNIKVIGFNPNMFLLQHKIKLVTKKLRIEIMSLSYHSRRLADVSICTVAMHRGLALSIHPVLLRHGSELVGRPVAAEPIPCLLILNQPIDPPEGAAPWSDRSRGPGWALSPASTHVCKKELHLHVKVKNQ